MRDGDPSARVREAMAGRKPVEDRPFELYAIAGGRDVRDGGSAADSADGNPPKDGVSAEDMATARECAWLDQNDRDNGRRLIRWFGRDLAFVSGMGWLVYTGTHWQRDEGELRARLLAQQLVDKIKLECLVIEEEMRKVEASAERIGKSEAKDKLEALKKRRDRRWAFAVSSGNATRTSAMLAQAASLKSVAPEALDADRMQFNCRNGTLVFGREPDPERPEGSDRLVGFWRFAPHDRDDMITKCADVAYDHDASCPQWEAFLARVQPQPVMRRFLQVFHAYALLIGGNDEQRLLYHFGTGANGKSVFLETLGRLADSYRAVVLPETITGDNQRDGSRANNDIARLHNGRLVTIEELPRGTPIKENLIKALTGGTKMIARYLQREFFEFEPIFTAVLSGNDKPTVSGTDYGIWRRLLIVHWSETIPEAERVPFGEMMARFDNERPGILNWLIDGLMLYLRDGLAAHVPAAVTEFTDDYREERDPVSTFCEAHVFAEPGGQVQANQMYEAYTRWCAINALTPWKQRAFGDRMSALGYAKIKGRLYFYKDVRLDMPPLPGGADMMGFGGR